MKIAVEEGQISIFDLPNEQKEVKESNKPKIRLLKDMKDLRQDFLKGNVYEVWMEQPENYIIRIDGVAYGPLKKSCEIV